MATFRKRGPYQWQTQVRKKSQPLQTKTFETRAEAKQWVHAIEVEMDKGVFVSRAGIENLRFHDLRHEATTRLFEKGLNIMEVASITGHKDLRMLRRYTHLKAEDLAKKLG